MRWFETSNILTNCKNVYIIFSIIPAELGRKLEEYEALVSQLQRNKISLSQNIEELKKQLDEETKVRETIFLTAQYVPAFMWNQFLLLIRLWHLLLSVKECLGSCPAIIQAWLWSAEGAVWWRARGQIWAAACTVQGQCRSRPMEDQVWDRRHTEDRGTWGSKVSV